MRSVVVLVVALLLFSYCAVAQQHVATSQYAWFVYYDEFELDTSLNYDIYVPCLSGFDGCYRPVWGWCTQYNGVLHCYTEIDWYLFYMPAYVDLRPTFVSSPGNALNFTAYVKVPCFVCEAGIALFNGAMDFAFNVVVTGEGYVIVRITNFVATANITEVYHYPTDVGYIGDTINRWFKIDVGVEIDYAGNMETSVRVSDADGNVLYSYSGAVFDVTAYQDYRYPAVYVYSDGYADNYGIYYPSLAIRGAVPAATVVVPTTVTVTSPAATVTSTVTVPETTTVMHTTTTVVPTTVASTETVVVPVERWSTATETVTTVEKVDYMAAAIVAVAALLLVVAIYVLLRRRR